MVEKRLDIEFKTTLIRLFKNLLEKADKINETYEDMKRDQLEIIRNQQEIKNTLSGAELEDGDQTVGLVLTLVSDQIKVASELLGKS